MALEPDIITLIKDLSKRLDALEKSSQIKNVKIPSGGKLVLPVESSDPTAENGRIYVSSTQARVCINSVWKTITVT